MGKKKRKINELAQHKLQLAQIRNEFKRRLKWFCSVIDREALYSLLPERIIEELFCMRGGTVIVTAAKGYCVPKGILNIFKIAFNRYLKDNQIKILKNGTDISLHDYFNIALPLQLYFNAIPDEWFPEAKEVKNGLSEYASFQERDTQVISDMMKVVERFAFIQSDFNNSFYQATYTIERIDKSISDMKLQSIIEIKSYKPEKRQILADDARRSAVRIGWSYTKSIHWLKIKPSQLDLPGTFSDIPLDVYIQQHALDRLHERIGGRYNGMMHMDLYFSLLKPQAILSDKKHFLLTYYIFGLKAGYLLAEITDGVILIRTFLFVTHSGTPEGKKLMNVTGLGKLDQKYLAFDSLANLANSDILSNEQAKEIFYKADCREVLELCGRIRNVSEFWILSENEQPLASRLLNYIRINQDSWNWDEPESPPSIVKAINNKEMEMVLD